MADLSGSISGNEPFISDAYETFVNRFELSEYGIRIGAYVFSDHSYEISGITSDKKKLLNAIGVIRSNPYGMSTNLTDAIITTHNEFAINFRKDSRRILILISDGAANEKDLFLQAIQNMKDNMGVEVCGIYIDTHTGEPEVMEIISEGYCYVASHYKELADILERLTICG
jgi:uncharacterized protein with von Willebrand factor type A (vWA) domain